MHLYSNLIEPILDIFCDDFLSGHKCTIHIYKKGHEHNFFTDKFKDQIEKPNHDHCFSVFLVSEGATNVLFVQRSGSDIDTIDVFGLIKPLITDRIGEVHTVERVTSTCRTETLAVMSRAEVSIGF